MLMQPGKIFKVGGRLFSFLPPSVVFLTPSRLIATGSNLTISVSAGGNAPFTYQWYKSIVTLPSETNPHLVLSNVQNSDTSTYQVIITNSKGSYTSNPVTVTVIDPVTITSQTSSLSVAFGSTVKLSITASGSTPIDYYWYKGSTQVGSASSYNIFSLDSSYTGTYYCVISNYVSTLTSDYIGLSGF